MPTESQIQCAFVEYVDTKYPHLKGHLIKITNEGKRSLAYGERMKREGLRRGVSDLFFAVPNKGLGGFWIEVKAPDEEPTLEQNSFLLRMQDIGYAAGWYDNLDDMINYFERYIEGMDDDQGRNGKDSQDTGS